MQIPVKMDSPIPRWKHAAHSALLPLPLREHGGVLRSFGTAAAAALVEEGVPPLLHLAAAAVASQYFVTKNRRHTGKSQPKRPPQRTPRPPHLALPPLEHGHHGGHAAAPARTSEDAEAARDEGL
eukprot:COSAG01_NODE_18997_length_1037_cov_1.536741_2_plen_125_part_00